MSGAGRRPCPDEPDDHVARVVGTQTARFLLPTIELSRRLTELLAEMATLASDLPVLVWKGQPTDPLDACRTLDGFIDQLERIEEKAAAARSTCLFLWNLSGDEGR